MDPREGWIEELGRLRKEGRPCVMVVVTAVDGSTPREAGARMLVADGRLAWGTIGGGNLERLAIERAAELLEPRAGGGSGSETAVYPLGERTGQCCGGRVTLFFEPFRWTRRTVAVFGAGHVAQSLGMLAPWLGAAVRLVDPRLEDEIQPALPQERPYDLHCVDSPEGELDALPDDALVVVMTHSHALDLTLLERALRRGGFAYLGLIGSERKWARFRDRLRARGFSEADLGRVHCPIGATRTSKEPAAIALSVAAELSEVMARSEAAGPPGARG